MAKKWSRTQIEVMARGSGWGKFSQDVSWVAMAESGGDSAVVNSLGCVGLLQINQKAHVGSHPQWTVKWLQDPMNNLSAGHVLFKAAGNRFDRDWADSQHKGGIPEGWGPHVSAEAGGGGAAQASDKDPCEAMKGTPAYDYCKRIGTENDTIPLDPNAPVDMADQIGRIAQAIAKAANWMADPNNWVRVAYVTGGAVLALVAVNVIIQPYANRAVGQVRGALPIQTARRYARYRRANVEASKSQESDE